MNSTNSDDRNDGQGEAGRMIQDTADRLLRDQCSKELVDAAEAGTWPAALWQTLMETGLPWASAPERLGGSALVLPEALGLLRLVGAHAAPVPLAETLIASALLGEDESVEQLPAGPLALVLASATDDFAARRTADGFALRGSVADVPFAPLAEVLVVAVDTGDGLLLLRVDPSSVQLEPGRNIAGEPVATVIFDDAEVTEAACSRCASLNAAEELLALLALSRALMSAGAMQSLLDMSVGYALERRQFGRPIAQFQAVQQQLAVLAGEAAAAIRAADGGLEAFAEVFRSDAAADPETRTRRIAMAIQEAGVAKARAGEAAGRGAEIAHQVHGAMGFTYEHRLHQRTRRLWAWRDQYGTETFWQARFGRFLCAAGGDALWDILTRPLD
ncbi:MAG: acyl-CoA/acyl-ACP dehydrogenase [Gammaproteobacteria bacterium]|nr:acyl-CoA/acyl-ACP dehydrogenase [Gammaproteobacteria bacterium]